jgi:hypothetical protein
MNGAIKVKSNSYFYTAFHIKVVNNIGLIIVYCIQVDY